jgi:hypothetical protein
VASGSTPSRAVIQRIDIAGLDLGGREGLRTHDLGASVIMTDPNTRRPPRSIAMTVPFVVTVPSV